MWNSPINGFCMVGLTNTWWDCAFSSECVFNPAFKLTRNEDEFQGRAASLGKTVGVAPGSFVWHYRGVTRNSIKGAQGTGWFRPKKKGK